jgi:hypothetical protein
MFWEDDLHCRWKFDDETEPRESTDANIRACTTAAEEEK